jgi:hypothetical protein
MHGNEGEPSNLPIETDLRKRPSPLASAAHWRRCTSPATPGECDAIVERAL